MLGLTAITRKGRQADWGMERWYSCYRYFQMICHSLRWGWHGWSYSLSKSGWRDITANTFSVVQHVRGPKFKRKEKGTTLKIREMKWLVEEHLTETGTVFLLQKAGSLLSKVFDYFANWSNCFKLRLGLLVIYISLRIFVFFSALVRKLRF